MNFFEAQERSHKNTRKLILLMTLAVIVVVASVSVVLTTLLWFASASQAPESFPSWLRGNGDLLIYAALSTAVFIGLASLFRIASLRTGGGRVARELGGVPLDALERDPLRRRLRNVVEEMSIASGVPTPEIFVLEHEPGINAFAAGFSTDDAAVAVTRGALENLNRDELQGVIAHEFSHVLNGDMRLNIKLMGPMFGILVITQLGRLLLRNMRLSGRGNQKGLPVVLIAGAGLLVIGSVGLLLGRLIKASVSRQREYLADASAVQFTRQSSGIAGALKKIGGLETGSKLQDVAAEEVSHMLFANGFKSLNNMFATHPPLIKRIQALEPGFTTEKYSQLNTETSNLGGHADSLTQTSGFAAPDHFSSSANPNTLLESIGNPGDPHYAIARELHARIPFALREAIDSSQDSMLLVIALILHPDAAERRIQLNLITKQIGSLRCERVADLFQDLATLKVEARLPILEMTLPILKHQPRKRLAYLSDLLEQIAESDGHLELFEYALLRLFKGYLQSAALPGANRRWRGLDDAKMLNAAVDLLKVIAAHGHGSYDAANESFQVGLAALGAENSDLPKQAGHWVQLADKALDTLHNCTPRGRETVIRALLATSYNDGQITQAESELLRCFCAILECPLPPLAGFKLQPESKQD